MENLRHLPHVPSVQMQPIGDDSYAAKCLNAEEAARDNANPDVRLHRKSLPTFPIIFADSISACCVSDTITDTAVDDQGEYYDNEKEGGDIRNEQSFKRVGSESEVGETEAPKKPKIEVKLVIKC